MPAYATSLEHLRAELERIALRVRLEIARPGTALDPPVPHLSTATDEEALFALLDRGSPLRGAPASPLSPVLAEAQEAFERATAEIARRCAESARLGVLLRLATLAERFGLDRLDQDILLLALLADLDREAEHLIARLDPAGRGRPTVGVALDLLASTFEARLGARARFAARAPLLRHDLIRLGIDPSGGRDTVLGRTIEVDERIAAYLQGDDAIDARLEPYARLIEPRARLDDLLLPAAQGLACFLRQPLEQGAPAPAIYLQGPYGAGRRTAAEALCREIGAPLLAVDCAALLVAGDDTFAAAARLVGREARLSGAAMHWIGADAALEDSRPVPRAALLRALAAHEGPAFLSGAGPWEPAGALGGRAFVRVELPRPSAAAQRTLWTRALAEERAPDQDPDNELDIAAITGAFRLTGGQIRDAADAARSLARLRGEGGGRVTMADLLAACRLRHGRKLAALARRLPPLHQWDDLVLPPDRKATLREICLQVKHRSRVLGEWGFQRKLATTMALSALFSGPPGTGKTMAASVMAAEIGVDLHHIDLSRVVSKYIGETEKHLAELFDDAEATGAALFFDEADAIFGKRTEVRDAHDRYANLETSYLLQRIESYEGVVILASNLVKNIDEAFVRRLGFVVEFPMPGRAERLKIWQGIWPAEAPLGSDVSLEFLAERIELSGGYLRNIAVAAAFLAAEEGAPVGMRHLLHAARREYQKMGKVVDAGKFAHKASATTGE